MTPTSTPKDNSNFPSFSLWVIVFALGIITTYVNVTGFALYMASHESCEDLATASTASRQFVPTPNEMTAMIRCRMHTNELTALHQQGLITDTQMALSIPKPPWWEDKKK